MTPRSSVACRPSATSSRRMGTGASALRPSVEVFADVLAGPARNASRYSSVQTNHRDSSPPTPSVATESCRRNPVSRVRPAAPTAAAVAAHASANSVLAKGPCSTPGSIKPNSATRSSWPLTSLTMRIHLAMKYAGRTRRTIPSTGRTFAPTCTFGTSDLQSLRSPEEVYRRHDTTSGCGRCRTVPGAVEGRRAPRPRGCATGPSAQSYAQAAVA